MDDEFLKAKLKDFCENVLHLKRNEKVHTELQYTCPFCNSGGGSHHTGAFTLNKQNNYKTYKCFSCGRGGDLFNLYEELNKCDFIQAKKELANIYNITLTNSYKVSRQLPDKKEEKKTSESFNDKILKFRKQEIALNKLREELKDKISLKNEKVFADTSFFILMLKEIKNFSFNRIDFEFYDRETFKIKFNLFENEQRDQRKYKLINYKNINIKERILTNIRNILKGNEESNIINEEVLKTLLKLFILNEYAPLKEIELNNCYVIGKLKLFDVYDFYNFTTDEKQEENKLLLLFLLEENELKKIRLENDKIIEMKEIKNLLSIKEHYKSNIEKLLKELN